MLDPDEDPTSILYRARDANRLRVVVVLGRPGTGRTRTLSRVASALGLAVREYRITKPAEPATVSPARPVDVDHYAHP